MKRGRERKQIPYGVFYIWNLKKKPKKIKLKQTQIQEKKKNVVCQLGGGWGFGQNR